MVKENLSKEQATQLFFEAAEKRDVFRCLQLVKYGIDLSAKEEKTGNTPLHIVAGFAPQYPQMKALPRYVAKMIQAGADANCENNDGFVPLKIMSVHAPAALIQATNAENINRVYADGETVLTDFVKKSLYGELMATNFSLPEGWHKLPLFLKKDVDLKKKNAEGYNALECYLLENMHQDPRPIRFFVMNDVPMSLAVRQMCARAQVKAHTYGSYMDYVLACKYFTACVYEAQKKGMHEKDANGNTLFHIFAKDIAPYVSLSAGQELMQEILKVSSVNAVNNDNQTPLHVAIEQLASKRDMGNLTQHLKQYVYMMLDMGAHPFRTDKNGNNALHLAMKTGDNELISVLQKQFPELEKEKNKAGCLPKDIARPVVSAQALSSYSRSLRVR